MKFAQRRCRLRNTHAEQQRKNKFIHLLMTKYYHLIDKTPELVISLDPNHITDKEIVLFLCNFLKALFSTYDCFKDLSYKWIRLCDELVAFQDQIDHDRVTRPLFKRSKIQRLLELASGIALQASTQKENNLLNLYDTFVLQVKARGGIGEIPSYLDYRELLHIIAIRMPTVIGNYLKFLTQNE